jgi:hypothetical protein
MNFLGFNLRHEIPVNRAGIWPTALAQLPTRPAPLDGPQVAETAQPAWKTARASLHTRRGAVCLACGHRMHGSCGGSAGGGSPMGGRRCSLWVEHRRGMGYPSGNNKGAVVHRVKRATMRRWRMGDPMAFIVGEDPAVVGSGHGTLLQLRGNGRMVRHGPIWVNRSREVAHQGGQHWRSGEIRLEETVAGARSWTNGLTNG